MSDRGRPKSTPSGGTPPEAPPAGKPGSSGRVQLDDRAQALWESSVKTGMFDRNADTQRIKKLLDEPSGLELVDYDVLAQREDGESAPPSAAHRPAGQPGAKPAPGTVGPPQAKPATLPDRATGFNPYERVEREPPQPKPRESGGGNPYSSGPAKKPENVSFNPYERTPRK